MSRRLTDVHVGYAYAVILVAATLLMCAWLGLFAAGRVLP